MHTVEVWLTNRALSMTGRASTMHLAPLEKPRDFSAIVEMGGA
ncbi:MAG TPA: hypothetical protein PK959_05150 [Candidatus Competibacteraceae bacterium]|nr:hypothetical protein [Candidatus Competibacteraceae bacterium]HSA46058.1 hypothetical protein [Candidatus Competibacteraceae bacterium]